MQAGISMSVGPDGAVLSARLMGGPDQCLVVDWPYERWCMREWPHDGDHEWNRDRDEMKRFEL